MKANIDVPIPSQDIKTSIIFILSIGILAACAPQATATLAPTQTQVAPTQMASLPTATLTVSPMPTETVLPSSTPPPTALSCAMAINPAGHVTIPASGPFDFAWTPFEGAASYVISIDPENWFPTNFPVRGTTLTRYMESFPSSPSYEWTIAAIGASGQEICKSGPYTFTTSADLYATPSFSQSGISVTENEKEAPVAHRTLSKKIKAAEIYPRSPTT